MTRVSQPPLGHPHRSAARNQTDGKDQRARGIQAIARGRSTYGCAVIVEVGSDEEREEHRFGGDESGHRQLNRAHTLDRSRRAVALGMRQIPQRSSPAHGRHGLEIMLRRRRTRCPFQRPCVPRIRTGGLSRTETGENIGEQHQNREPDHEHARCGEHVHGGPAGKCGIGVDAARHSIHTQNVLDEKRHVEAYEHQPEVQPTHAFGEHPSAHLWKPVIQPRHHREQSSAEQNVVHVRYYVIRVSELPIEGDGREGDAGQPADGECEQKRDGEQHGGVEANGSAPHGGEPVENFHSSGNGDQQTGSSERVLPRVAQTDREHMMRPHAQAQQPDGDGGGGDERIAEDRLAREHGNDFGNDAKRRQHHDVDFRMSESPEIVLPENRRSAPDFSEEVRVQ